MTRKFLEGFGLDKEAINKILDVNSGDIGSIKSKLETVKSENKQLKEALSDKDQQLKLLKNVDANSLMLKIQTLEDEKKQSKAAYLSEIKALQLDNAIERAMRITYLRKIKVACELLSLEDVECGDNWIKSKAR